MSKVNPIYRLRHLVPETKQKIKSPTYSFLAFSFIFIAGAVILSTLAFRIIFPRDHKLINSLSDSAAELPDNLLEEELLNKLTLEPGNENIIREIFHAKKNTVANQNQTDDEIPHDAIPLPNLKPVYEKVKSISTIPEKTIRGWFDYEIYGAGTALKYLHESGWSIKDPLQTGIILYEEKRFNEALEYFQKALTINSELDTVKSYIFYSNLELGGPVLEQIVLDKSYSRIIDHGSLSMYYLKKKEYRKMIPHLILSEIRSYSASSVSVSLITGFAWVLFILQMGYASRWPLHLKLLPVPAIMLGFLSAHMTMITVAIQDQLIHFDGSNNYPLEKILAYYIAGVGVREEVIKLIFFIPLAFFLKKDSDDLRILAVASLVGLGFAIEENINYYVQFAGSSVVSRFLTANFFHMTLTGYCGYYLVKALQKGGEAWSDFIIQTLLMIFIHGVYDFLLSSDPNGSMAFFAMGVFIIITRRYLRLFLTANVPVERKISLPFIFVSALALTVGMTFFLITDYITLFLPAIFLLMNSLTGVFFIVYMFFYEMRGFVVRK